jgi:hypothetical protein
MKLVDESESFMGEEQRLGEALFASLFPSGPLLMAGVSLCLDCTLSLYNIRPVRPGSFI